MPIIIRNLNFSYGAKEIFHHFHLECTAPISLLKGPSGCGKTTLLKILADDDTKQKESVLGVKQPVFLLLQSDALAPWLSGRQNAAIFSSKILDKISASPLFPMVENFYDSPAYKLSYGQRRTIELLLAFESRPSTLLLDEPFNFLDRHRRRQFINHMLYAMPDTSFIITSHYEESKDITGAEVFEFIGDAPYSALNISRDQANETPT